MPNVDFTKGVESSPIDLEPQTSKNRLEGCTVIDLRQFKNKVALNGHTLRIIDGIGYDWNSIQLGEATESAEDPANLNGTRFEYEFSGVQSDSVTIHDGQFGRDGKGDATKSCRQRQR